MTNTNTNKKPKYMSKGEKLFALRNFMESEDFNALNEQEQLASQMEYQELLGSSKNAAKKSKPIFGKITKACFVFKFVVWLFVMYLLVSRLTGSFGITQTPTLERLTSQQQHEQYKQNNDAQKIYEDLLEMINTNPEFVAMNLSDEEKQDWIIRTLKDSYGIDFQKELQS